MRTLALRCAALVASCVLVLSGEQALGSRNDDTKDETSDTVGSLFTHAAESNGIMIGHLEPHTCQCGPSRPSIIPLDSTTCVNNDPTVSEVSSFVSSSLPPSTCSSKEHTSTQTGKSNMTEIKSNTTELMVYVKKRRFYMGTAKPFILIDAEDRRQVEVNSFWIDKYEVSNTDFRHFIEDTGYVTDSEKFGWSFVFKYALSPAQIATLSKAVKNAEWWLPVENSSWLYPEGFGIDVFSSDRSDHPVVHISWNDAIAYCKWRDSRLPTEAEWELAAGGGKHELFPWGKTILTQGVHRANIFQGTFPNHNSVKDGYEFTAPVHAYPPQNELGIHNIIGNAWEWVSDIWTVDHNLTSIQKNPIGPSQGKERTKKGGSFLCHKSFCYRYRVAARHRSTADSATSNSGFRCAKTPSKSV